MKGGERCESEEGKNEKCYCNLFYSGRILFTIIVLCGHKNILKTIFVSLGHYFIILFPSHLKLL
jgi:hypothetical protein